MREGIILNGGNAMNEYDLINAYLHLIYNNSTVFLYRILEKQENFELMKQWLVHRGISLSFMEAITPYNFTYCCKATNLDSLQSIFHEDFKESFYAFRKQEKRKYQVLFLAGVDTANSINQAFIDQEYVHSFFQENCSVYHCTSMLKADDISFNGPYSHFLKALYQIDKWPGILVFKEEQWTFQPIQTLTQVDIVFAKIQDGTIFESSYIDEEDSYFIQLSDLHLGTKNKNKGRLVLEESLTEICSALVSKYPIKFLITGDLMNSPNRKNMYEASSFMNMLKKKYKGDVTFILGNHDVIVHGFNFWKRQKAKVVAYLLGENIKVLEKEKIILIKINSMVEGNLARGKVGEIQLQEIDDELASIENIEEYTLMAMVHHHIFSITKDEFLKTRWHENMFVGRIVETSKVLVDAKELVEWLKKHHIRYAFHGHKHLPFFSYREGVFVISGGSSCGGGAKESKSRYLSYNVLKYSQQTKAFKYCFIFYDDMTKQERQRVKVHLF